MRDKLPRVMLCGVTLPSRRAPVEFADVQLGCFLGLRAWEGGEAGAGADCFSSIDIWPRFSSPGYIRPAENYAPLSPTPFPFCGAFHKCSCFSEKVYFGSCFHLTYIKHSHKAEASRGVQGGLLALCAVLVSRVREADKLMPIVWELRLKWLIGLPRAASYRKL